MRPLIADVIARLLVRERVSNRIDLNDIEEEIGDASVSFDEVELIVGELEARGLDVGGPPNVVEMGLLRQVISAARALTGELGRAPTPREVAERSGQPTFVVRRALENARKLAAAGKP